MIRATAFDLPYKVTIGGITYGGDSLANIRLSRSLSGKGFYGIATAEFACDIYTGVEMDFPENTEAVFSGALLGDFPSFYLTSCSNSKGVCSIVCHDCCKNLDLPFDYSGYEQFDESGKAVWYPSSQIIGSIAGISNPETGWVLVQTKQLASGSQYLYLKLVNKTIGQVQQLYSVGGPYSSISGKILEITPDGVSWEVTATYSNGTTRTSTHFGKSYGSQAWREFYGSSYSVGKY